MNLVAICRHMSPHVESRFMISLSLSFSLSPSSFSDGREIVDRRAPAPVTSMSCRIWWTPVLTKLKKDMKNMSQHVAACRNMSQPTILL